MGLLRVYEWLEPKRKARQGKAVAISKTRFLPTCSCQGLLNVRAGRRREFRSSRAFPCDSSVALATGNTTILTWGLDLDGPTRERASCGSSGLLRLGWTADRGPRFCLRHALPVVGECGRDDGTPFGGLSGGVD